MVVWVGSKHVSCLNQYIVAKITFFTDGPLYVARVHIVDGKDYELLPGYLDQKSAVITRNGEVMFVPKYELLVNCDQEWIKTVGDNVPDDALIGDLNDFLKINLNEYTSPNIYLYIEHVLAGRMKNGDYLYVCRTEIHGNKIIGKLQQQTYSCKVPYGQLEVSDHFFEILKCKK